MMRPEIPESAATGQLAEIYEDIRNTLGTPVVNLVFRLLAAFPPYLEIAWPDMQANLRSACADNIFQKIRTIAAKPLGSLPDLPDAGADLSKIISVLDLYNEINPKGLLTATAWRKALDSESAPAAASNAMTPAPPRALRSVPPMVEVSAMNADMQALLEEIRTAHGIGGVPSLYRMLAWWPEWLTKAWPALSVLVMSPALATRRNELLGLVADLASSLPHPMGPSRQRLRDAGFSSEEISDIARVLDDFQQGIPVALITGLAIRQSVEVGADVPGFSQ